MKRLASTEIPSVRYISYKGLDIAKKPSQYFNSYSLFTGLVKYNDTFYTMKKIPLDESINPNDLPEVQIINSNTQCPFIISYLDYILEQTETSEGAWVNKALYILMENSDYDLRTYLIKYGALDENGLCDLTECLIGANHYLQKELNMAHGDIRPQNVRIIMKNVPGENRKELEFKLSYLDDVLNVNSCGVNKVDTMAYMAPELLCSSVVNSNYETNEPCYQPGQDLLKLITECPDEIRYDPFRADLFSVGLTIFSATTGILFSFKLPAQSFEVKRNGPNEENIICQNLRLIKAKYQNDGYNEILRILLNPNPILRYDFEEIVLRLNKVSLRLNYSECVIDTGDSKVKKELEATKEAIYELQKMISDMEKREIEYKDKIETLSNQLRKHTATPGNDVKTGNEQGLMNNILGELSSIYDDQTNFINSISSIKLLTNFEFPDKTQTPGGPVGLVEQVEEKSAMTSKGSYFVKKSSINADYTKKPSEERALQKEKKVNHGLINHQEFKESIIRRRDHI